jgi:hypothetical protein
MHTVSEISAAPDTSWCGVDEKPLGVRECRCRWDVGESVMVTGGAELGKVEKSVFVFPLSGLYLGSGDHVECGLGGWLGWRWWFGVGPGSSGEVQ